MIDFCGLMLAGWLLWRIFNATEHYRPLNKEEMEGKQGRFTL